MNILAINWQDIKNPYGGGAEIHFHRIFEKIVRRGHEVTLLCCKYEGCKKEEVIEGIKIIRRGSRNLFNYIVPRLYKKLDRQNDYDLIIDDINKIPFFTPLYVKKPLLAISHHFFGKSIFRETNPLFGTYVYLSEQFVDVLYKDTPFAVVSESTMQEFLDRGFDSKLFSIVPNAIEQSAFPMKYAKEKKKSVITYFGRLKKYKSVDHLLQAFAIIKDKVNAELHILGTGNFREELEKLSRELKIDDRIYFSGYISEEQKIEYLSQSYCAVNTSMKEGWGITNIEANACGTPVISANVPGLKDSVKDGLSGMLYEYGNIEHLANLLLKIINDNDLRYRLSIGALEWASGFSWDKSADLMLEKCHEVIEKHKS